MTEQRVRIVHFDVATLEALARGDLPAADDGVPVRLTSDFIDPGWLGLWRRRRDQVRADRTAADWVTGAIVDTANGTVVGRAGFHGPPDDNGMVEVGYVVLPQSRRQGFGRAALAELLRRAAADPGVRVVRASISPDNLASRRLVESFGFVAVGDQWDDEDGLEIVYETPAR